VPLQVEPIESKIIRDQVLDAIEKALVSGELRPEDRVNEAEIARDAGISRGPVREAIQHLVAEGILVNVPHRGTYVAQWTKRDVAETYGLRALLESYAASLAKERMSVEEMTTLENIVSDMEACARRGDAACLSELDLEFHHRLYELSGHTLLMRVLRDLWRRISMLVNFDASTSPDLIEYAQNHRMLLDAIKSGDGIKIEQVFREHIIGIGDIIIQRMEETESATDPESTNATDSDTSKVFLT
jgi:DNA-binding GntR family transcriptional regulator